MKLITLAQIHKTLIDMNGEVIFNLKKGTYKKVLLGNNDHEKLGLFTYMIGEICNNDHLDDAVKIDLISMMTLGLNIVLHGELEDKVREA